MTVEAATMAAMAAGGAGRTTIDAEPAAVAAGFGAQTGLGIPSR